MRRGDLFRVRRPAGDPRPARVFVVVSRQPLIDARFPTVVCAPVHSEAEGLATQVRVGPDNGLKHGSWILCDALASLPKERLTDFVGSLTAAQQSQLRRALAVALDLF